MYLGLEVVPMNKTPEYASIETFVEHCIADEAETFSHEDVTALNFQTSTPARVIKLALESYGLKLAKREPARRVRGFQSNPHDRFSACPMHGGAQFSSMMMERYGSKDAFASKKDEPEAPYKPGLKLT